MNLQLSRLLRGAIFEVIPMKNAAEKALGLPPASVVSVTASPAKGMIATVELSEHLASQGYEVIPHLSARLTKTQDELAFNVARLAAAGIDRAFIVGGDADEPGDFFDAAALIRGLAAIEHPFAQLGVTGYPEGHPFIPEAELMSAMIEKAPAAAYVATQMCFDVKAIGRWIERIRSAGVTLPVFVGIPGASEATKLMAIGARIGVGTSLRYLAKNRKSIGKLIRPGTFTPDEIVQELASLPPELGISGLHVFTFNQIEDTVAWYSTVSG
jgi:methylenetetrahydrofolate reductase (NADPH)